MPDAVQDPILIEIVGLFQSFLAAQGGEASDELCGMPAAKGEVTGIAKAMHPALKPLLLDPGDIFVCAGTAPSWTKIGGCVRDTGGTLTHASIVGREYGLPCVDGTAVAASVIETGVRVTVNGAEGIVRIRPEAT